MKTGSDRIGPGNDKTKFATTIFGEGRGEREIEMDLFGNPIGYAAVQRVVGLKRPRTDRRGPTHVFELRSVPYIPHQLLKVT